MNVNDRALKFTLVIPSNRFLAQLALHLRVMGVLEPIPSALGGRKVGSLPGLVVSLSQVKCSIDGLNVFEHHQRFMRAHCTSLQSG